MTFFTYGFEKRAAERLVGGKADGKPDSAFPEDQLRMGRRVEREHTKDPKAANEVAKDHLTEDSKYYTHLKEMEDKYVKTAFVSGFEKKAISVERVQRVIRSRMQGSPIKDELVGAFMGLSSRSSKMQPAERALAKKSIQEVQAAVPNLGRKGPLPEPKTPMDFFEQNYKQLQKDKALAPTYKEIDEYVAKQKEKDPFNVKFLKEGFEKRAWDSDHESKSHYGISANRSISREGATHIQDSLASAAKDPHLEVEIFGPDGSGHSKDSPKRFEKMLSSVRAATGPRPKSMPDDRMDWHRDYSWSISGRKDNPIFKPESGERASYGGKASVHTKIYDYIHSKYKV